VAALYVLEEALVVEPALALRALVLGVSLGRGVRPPPHPHTARENKKVGLLLDQKFRTGGIASDVAG
jgi:hypothetical protein